MSFDLVGVHTSVKHEELEVSIIRKSSFVPGIGSACLRQETQVIIDMFVGGVSAIAVERLRLQGPVGGCGLRRIAMVPRAHAGVTKPFSQCTRNGGRYLYNFFS